MKWATVIEKLRQELRKKVYQEIPESERSLIILLGNNLIDSLAELLADTRLQHRLRNRQVQLSTNESYINYIFKRFCELYQIDIPLLFKVDKEQRLFVGVLAPVQRYFLGLQKKYVTSGYDFAPELIVPPLDYLNSSSSKIKEENTGQEKIPNKLDEEKQAGKNKPATVIAGTTKASIPAIAVTNPYMAATSSVSSSASSALFARKPLMLESLTEAQKLEVEQKRLSDEQFNQSFNQLSLDTQRYNQQHNQRPQANQQLFNQQFTQELQNTQRYNQQHNQRLQNNQQAEESFPQDLQQFCVFR
ncbi:MAG: hypothetical protein ABI597_11265 [Gammaproteobacteria bacterium]